MKAITVALAIVLVLGAVASSPAVEPVEARHEQCPEPDMPCNIQPHMDPKDWMCAALGILGFC